MTGGIGFSRDGNNALRKNKDLLNSRKSNAENPYWGSKRVKRKKASNFHELADWKILRVSSLRKRSAIIFILVGLIVIMTLISIQIL